MSQRLQADAVIIGGGIVGGSAALFIRQAGLSVILLDKGFCGAQAGPCARADRFVPACA
jgi:sarcosine oxidase subunit beta